MLRAFAPVKAGIEAVALTAVRRGCWIDCMAPPPDELETLAGLTGIPLRALARPLDPDARPAAIEHIGWSMILCRAPLVFKADTIRFDVRTAPLGLFITPKYVLTVHAQHEDVINHMIAHAARGERILDRTSRFVIHLLRQMTNRYYHVLRELEHVIDRIETDVIEAPRRLTMRRIAGAKKALADVHRSLLANRLALAVAAEQKLTGIAPADLGDLRGINAQTTQLAEMALMWRDVLAGDMNIYEYTLSMNLNSAMKMLTVIAAILILPTVITGLYGMNVALPLAESVQAFWIIIAIIALFLVLTLAIFRKKGLL